MRGARRQQACEGRGAHRGAGANAACRSAAPALCAAPQILMSRTALRRRIGGTGVRAEICLWPKRPQMAAKWAVLQAVAARGLRRACVASAHIQQRAVQPAVRSVVAPILAHQHRDRGREGGNAPPTWGAFGACAAAMVSAIAHDREAATEAAATSDFMDVAGVALLSLSLSLPLSLMH